MIKQYFKMYKAGKRWLIAAITVMGVALGSQAAYADTATTSAAPSPVPTAQSPTLTSTSETPAPVASSSQAVAAPSVKSPAPAPSVAPAQATSPIQTASGHEVQRNGAWYYVQTDGTQTTGWQCLADGRVVYYDAKTAQMVHGEKYFTDTNRWLYLDQINGALHRGFTTLPDGRRVYYDVQADLSGAGMLHGVQAVGQQTYSFDPWDGHLKTGWQTVNGHSAYFAPSMVKQAERHIDGHWYYFNGQGVMATGLTTLPDGRLVYYNKQGQMQYGEQPVNGKWLFFDQNNGSIKQGWFTLPDGRQVYYDVTPKQNGFTGAGMLHGVQVVGKQTYNFDTWDGRLKTGWQTVNGQRAYFAPAMVKQAERHIDGHWYYFNAQGVMATGLTILPDGRLVYYNKQGQMQYGEQPVNGKWLFFDQNNGSIKQGWFTLPDGRRVYYDVTPKQNGFTGAGMLHGDQQIGQRYYRFDAVNGKLLQELTNTATYDQQAHKLRFLGHGGWLGANQRFYDHGQTFTTDAQGYVVLTAGEHYLGQQWYLAGADGTVKTGWQTLPDGRLVYYDPTTAAMVKGERNLAGHWYYFNPQNGAKTTRQYVNLGSKIVYYNDQGQMLYGWQTIDGQRRYFDRWDGAEALSTILPLDGHWYAFDRYGTPWDLQAVNNLINRLGSKIAFAVQSQVSGQVYSYSNANQRFITASTVKVALLAELLHKAGGNLSAYQRSLAEKMIRNSDNAAATAIANQLGRNTAGGDLYRALGMSSTTPTYHWGQTRTTPQDQLKLLAQIYLTDHSGYLNQRSQAYLRELMHTVSAGQRWGISAGSSDYYVKNGWLSLWSNAQWYVDSIGFLPNHGRGYTLAIYSEGNPLATGINKVEQVARLVQSLLG
ncbi:serine hydrolase [Limosilactobacillus ingluviei]